MGEGNPTDSAHAQADPAAQDMVTRRDSVTATHVQVCLMKHLIWGNVNNTFTYFSCGHMVKLGILVKLHEKLWNGKIRPISLVLGRFDFDLFNYI